MKSNLVFWTLCSRTRCSRTRPTWVLGVAVVLALLAVGSLPAEAAQCTVSSQLSPTGLPHPILFVTQFPIAADFATIGSTFANHFARVSKVGRGGDLFILYPDGTLCNLTREAGFGAPGAFQGADAIAVRRAA